MHVLLMGLRGSGKTTVGGLLARQLDGEFVDLDDRVLATFAETTVTDVFSAHGEQAWRAAEARVLHELLSRTAGRDSVIALGAERRWSNLLAPTSRQLERLAPRRSSTCDATLLNSIAAWPARPMIALRSPVPTRSRKPPPF